MRRLPKNGVLDWKPCIIGQVDRAGLQLTIQVYGDPDTDDDLLLIAGVNPRPREADMAAALYSGEELQAPAASVRVIGAFRSLESAVASGEEVARAWLESPAVDSSVFLDLVKETLQ